MKKVWVYIVIVFIIILTILGMIFLSNNVNLSFEKEEVINNIINTEAIKINKNYPWVYTYQSGKDNILIPYFNINNKLLKKINEENINDDYSNALQASYLYSINDSLLSLLFTKEYENINEYKVYNFNLKSSKLMSSNDTLNYLNIDYDTLLNKIYLSVELYLKKYNYSSEMFELYYENTINHIIQNDLNIYIGSNKEIYVIVSIYHNQVDNVLFEIGG